MRRHSTKYDRRLRALAYCRLHIVDGAEARQISLATQGTSVSSYLHNACASHRWQAQQVITRGVHETLVRELENANAFHAKGRRA